MKLRQYWLGGRISSSGRRFFLINRKTGVVLAMVGLAGLAVAVWVASRPIPAGVTVVKAPHPPVARPAPPGVSKLVWSDEFNAAAGTPPDPTKWNMDVGGGGWGNNEWEYYTSGADNVAQDGRGYLVITARRPAGPPGGCAYGPCDITSARLQTEGRFATTYGRIESRIKVPVGRGLWPAFWMLPPDDSGEIDIMENNGREPSVVSGTLHGPGFSGPMGLSAEDHFLPGNMADVFHVYAVDWSPAAITWSVDGRVFQTISRDDPRVKAWVYDRPYYLLLNLAVGSADPGYPDATTAFPAQMLIDYVRVYR